MAFVEGNPTIYWYPDPAGTLQKTSFGEGLSDLHELPVGDVEDSYAGDLTPFRSFFGVSQRLRVVLERFGTWGGNALERELTSLQRHLVKGNFVGFSADDAKTWASVASSAPSRGDTVVYTPGTGYAAWSASGTVLEEDELVIESAHPEAQLEVAVLDHLTVAPPPVHLPIVTPGVLYTYAQTTHVRWRDFYPVCWLPKDQVGKPIVTHDHRGTYTLDVTLEYSVAASIALFTDPGNGEGGAFLAEAFSLPPLKGTSSGAGSSLEDLLRSQFGSSSHVSGRSAAIDGRYAGLNLRQRP